MVYLVIYGLYYETLIDQVFKTKKAAESRIKELDKTHKKDEYSGAEIMEMELK